jgi:ribose/xylose/arabinose/galactoside ABC-type transport system permease subunit
MRRAAAILLRRMPLLLAAVLLVVLVLNVPAFRRAGYWLSLSREHFAVAALALALVPIMLTGGIDLSVGSIAVLSSLVIEYCHREWGFSVPLSLACGVAAGAIAGAVNGLVVRAGVLPLVATLATGQLYRGVAWLMFSEDPDAVRLPSWLGIAWLRPHLGLPIALWGLIALAVGSYLFVHHSWAGRALFAIGDNERAARYAAVPVGRLKLLIYTWAGLVAGLCGVGLVMKYPAAKVDAERSLELLAIACVVMGGVRVTGGSGHVGGAALGVVTVTALLAGLRQTGSEWRDTACGVALIVMALAGEAGARWVSQGSGVRSQESDGTHRTHRSYQSHH